MTSLPEFDCLDCPVNTDETDEYYMVHDYIWREAGMDDGMLCINCLEVRIGYALTKAHFTDAPVNYMFFLEHHKRFED